MINQPAIGVPPLIDTPWGLGDFAGWVLLIMKHGGSWLSTGFLQLLEQEKEVGGSRAQTWLNIGM